MATSKIDRERAKNRKLREEMKEMEAQNGYRLRRAGMKTGKVALTTANAAISGVVARRKGKLIRGSHINLALGLVGTIGQAATESETFGDVLTGGLTGHLFGQSAISVYNMRKKKNGNG